MTPFVVLVAVSLVLRGIGIAGVGMFGSWSVCLRGGLFAMFLVTASAHWGKRRSDLIRMVPGIIPRPDLAVTATGILELLGAAGLLIPATAATASVCLAVLLLALFPANVRAAQRHLAIGGRTATPLILRTLLQIAFIGALAVVFLSAADAGASP